MDQILNGYISWKAHHSLPTLAPKRDVGQWRYMPYVCFQGDGSSQTLTFWAIYFECFKGDPFDTFDTCNPFGKSGPGKVFQHLWLHLSEIHVGVAHPEEDDACSAKPFHRNQSARLHCLAQHIISQGAHFEGRSPSFVAHIPHIPCRPEPVGQNWQPLARLVQHQEEKVATDGLLLSCGLGVGVVSDAMLASIISKDSTPLRACECGDCWWPLMLLKKVFEWAVDFFGKPEIWFCSNQMAQVPTKKYEFMAKTPASRSPSWLRS